MAVKLREKILSNGQVSFYLDIYHNKKRWYEFLNIYVNRKKPTEEDKEKKRLAGEIRAKREHELIVDDNGLIDKRRKLADFVSFFESYVGAKPRNGQYSGTLFQLHEFNGNKSFPISRLTTEWMKDFERFLLKRVSSNSALSYLKNINGALNELVRKQIIPRNPWHAVPKHDRLKKKDVMRTAWTLEQLQHLAHTLCNIEPQFKQAYFFACFTGLRWSDINGLKWSNIIRKNIHNVEQWFIHFEQQKTETIEYFPLSDQAVDIVKLRQTESEESPYVFPLVKETDPKNYRVHGNVDYALKKWAKAAGLDHTKMRFHTGRHTYATNLLELTNGDLYTVSKLLGHKSIQTTQIYAQVRDKMKDAAVRSLPRLDFMAGHKQYISV
jgi:integrase